MLTKGLWALVLLSLLGSARCYNADLAEAFGGLPIVGPIVQPPEPVPQYVNAIGTPAPPTLPETDFATWFPVEPAEDPYALPKWQAVETFVSVAGTRSGWALACKAVSDAAGADRGANPKLGALACSADPTVTVMQQFALHVLGAQASVALWMKGEWNGSTGAIQARQAEIRVLCETSVIARQGPQSPWPAACAKALDPAYLAGDGPTTFAALGEAYAAAAEELARLDPKIAGEPGYFGGGGAAQASPTPAP